MLPKTARRFWKSQSVEKVVPCSGKLVTTVIFRILKLENSALDSYQFDHSMSTNLAPNLESNQMLMYRKIIQHLHKVSRVKIQQLITF